MTDVEPCGGQVTPRILSRRAAPTAVNANEIKPEAVTRQSRLDELRAMPRPQKLILACEGRSRDTRIADPGCGPAGLVLRVKEPEDYAG